MGGGGGGGRGGGGYGGGGAGGLGLAGLSRVISVNSISFSDEAKALIHLASQYAVKLEIQLLSRAGSPPPGLKLGA